MFILGFYESTLEVTITISSKSGEKLILFGILPLELSLNFPKPDVVV